MFRMLSEILLSTFSVGVIFVPFHDLFNAMLTQNICL